LTHAVPGVPAICRTEENGRRCHPPWRQRIVARTRRAACDKLGKTRGFPDPPVRAPARPNRVAHLLRWLIRTAGRSPGDEDFWRPVDWYWMPTKAARRNRSICSPQGRLGSAGTHIQRIRRNTLFFDAYRSPRPRQPRKLAPWTARAPESPPDPRWVCRANCRPQGHSIAPGSGCWGRNHPTYVLPIRPHSHCLAHSDSNSGIPQAPR